MNIMMTSGAGRHHPNDEAIGQMIEGAGSREAIPQEDLEAIRSAARATWQMRVRSRRRNTAGVLALAAAITLAVIGTLLWPRTTVAPGPAEVVASFERVSGDVILVDGDSTRAIAVEGASARAGELIEVGDGAAALRIGEATSLRLAEQTRARILDPERIELITGAVYVDTAQRGRLEVATPYGEARDIGTQFLVQVDAVAETMRVAVREGEVSVRQDGQAHELSGGNAITLSADGKVEREAVPAWGETWSWVLDASPGYDIEGRALSSYLQWVASETGLEIRYEDSWVENLATETTLHGSTGELRPDEAVLVVLPGAGLEGEIVDGALEVRRPR